MKDERLTGYVLHARPYQEKRAIYQFFSREWGVVHGVGVRGLPLFVLTELFASGQSSLKTFRQMTPTASPFFKADAQAQYALFYMNEVLYKLLAPESPCPMLWQSYQQSLTALTKSQDLLSIKRILRQFESELFTELGVGIDWGYDGTGGVILPEVFYDYLPNQGFVPSQAGIQGKRLLEAFSSQEMSADTLMMMGQIHRKLIDELLSYQPLNSRTLWANWQKYSQPTPA